jgi:hypothetical protein
MITSASIIDEVVRPTGEAQPLLWMAAGAMLAGAIVVVLGVLGSLVGRRLRAMQPPPDEDTAGTAGWELGPLDDPAAWDTAADDQLDVAPDVLYRDVAPDGSHETTAAAAVVDGQTHVEVVETRPTPTRPDPGQAEDDDAYVDEAGMYRSRRRPGRAG